MEGRDPDHDYKYESTKNQISHSNDTIVLYIQPRMRAFLCRKKNIYIFHVQLYNLYTSNINKDIAEFNNHEFIAHSPRYALCKQMQKQTKEDKFIENK